MAKSPEKVMKKVKDALTRAKFSVDVDEKNSAFFITSGKRVYSLFFDGDGESFSLKIFSLRKFKKEHLPDVYDFCNAMHKEWRWIRFYVDGEDELTADIDAIINLDNCVKVTFEVLSRIENITNKIIENLS